VGRKGRGKDARAPGQGDGKNGYRKGRSGKSSDVTTNVTLHSSISDPYGISTVTYIQIVRQRLGKHIPVGANERKSRTSIARQRISKHA
jgi:hypothetical protein